MRKLTAIIGTLLVFIGCGTDTKTEYVDRNVTHYVDRNVTVIEYVDNNISCTKDDDNLTITAGYKQLGDNVVEVTFITTKEITEESVLLEVSYDEFLEWLTFTVDQLSTSVYRGSTQVVLPTKDANISCNFKFLSTDEDLRVLEEFTIEGE